MENSSNVKEDGNSNNLLGKKTKNLSENESSSSNSINFKLSKQKMK